MENESCFDEDFQCLTGARPFPWQQQLFRRFVVGDFPDSCNLPTGLGKTSIVAIWLIALLRQPHTIPRRLVYVVNRRTVVDQTTTEVERIRENLRSTRLGDSLAKLSALRSDDESPLALSTLRGQFADNRDWVADPSRPAVIVGTVDMIGSRLLFSGYGVGFKSKPMHAGFIGQDALLVHDEAHLEPAFQKLLNAVKREQLNCSEFRAFHVIALSATSRGSDKPFGLTREELAPPHVLPEPPTEPIHIVWRRLTANKSIHFHEVNEEKKTADEVADLALQFKDSNRAVLIFLRKLVDVEKAVARLRAAKLPTQQLTGTLRGLERNALIGDDIVRRFLPGATVEDTTVYLVCTSAGEVGVNFSADHLVCDLSTFESMAQRFGRLNRFGDRSDSEIHIVHPDKFDQTNKLDLSRFKTINLMRSLDGDGSPKALNELDRKETEAAFSPDPQFLRTSEILFDTWALTTIRGKLPGRPPVEPYLHGVSDWEPPETRVAWREEVWVLRPESESGMGRNQLEQMAADLLDDYPLKPHEFLSDRSDRVFKHLTTIAAKHPDYPVWLLNDDGNVEMLTLGLLAENDRKEQIYLRTILLPPEAGGLTIENDQSSGMFNGSANYDAERRPLYDVADEWTDKFGRRRVRLRDNDDNPPGMRLIRTVAIPSKQNDDEAENIRWNWYERQAGGDSDGSKTNRLPVEWLVHTEDVEHMAQRIVGRHILSEELRAAIILAAKFHDLGKKRAVWQRDIGNDRYPGRVLAKSGGRMKLRNLGSSYRHEFGSLINILDPQLPYFNLLKSLSDEMQEVVLHLVAAHHGFARPHFPVDNAMDPEACVSIVRQIVAEVPRRFARLQRKYGRWGLAYLESLLRAADYAASSNPSKFEEDMH